MNKAVLYNKRVKRKQKVILVAEKGGRCEHCKRVFPAICYDFHHRDPTKKEITFNSSASLARKRKEAKKCLLLCSCCHRLEHERIREAS